MTEKVKLTFLGTSGMIPDAKRGHPAFLLTYKAENILVDCGEGTQIQFRKAGLNPCKVTKILITHWHGDHTFGLPGLLRTLETSGYNKKLEIYGPRGFKKHMDEMFKAFGSIIEYKIEVHEIPPGDFFENSDFVLQAEKMIHVQPCYAYNFIAKGHLRIDKAKIRKLKIPEGKHFQELKAGKTMAYNGKKFKVKDLTFKELDKKISFVLDTLNNDKIAPFVRDADALVCEASFSSEEQTKAREYKHLTSVQTAEIAKRARVKKLFLVHVSQRYSLDYQKILREAKKIFKNSFLPRDLESIEI